MSTLRHRLRRSSMLRRANRMLHDLRFPDEALEVQHQLTQRALAANWMALVAQGTPPRLADTGFKCHSQLEEDGLLLYIFCVIGSGRKTALEMCAADGRECMAANLVVHHGWHAVLYDGDPLNVEEGRRFFAQNQFTFAQPPEFRQAWVTRENVNDLVQQAGLSGEIDLLSLDIDGNDYWVWEALTAVQPRVCVIETHNVIPSELSLAMPYQADFSYERLPEERRDFRGASLRAFVRLAARKGYRLIGANRLGFNAFFMRGDVGVAAFPEVSVASCHDNPYTRHAQAERWPRVSGEAWVSV